MIFFSYSIQKSELFYVKTYFTKFDCILFHSRWNPFLTLCTVDQSSTVTEFLKTKPNIQEINNTFQFYEEIENKFKNLQSFHNIGILCLNLDPLEQTLNEHLANWKKSLGSAILQQTLEELSMCNESINVSVEAS